MERPRQYTDKLIQRNSPTVRVQLGGRAVDLTWYSTTVVMYHEPFRDMSHLRVVGEKEDDPNLLVFGIHSNPQAKELMELRFPINYEPEPKDYVIEAYEANNRERIDAEHERLMGDGGSDE